MARLHQILSQSSKFFLNGMVATSLYLSFPLFAADDGQLNYEKALSAFTAKQFDESFIYLKNSLLADPENLPAKILMGKLLVEKGEYRAAETEFDEAIHQGADISFFATYWASSLFLLKKYQQIIDFDEFSRFSPEQIADWHEIRARACIRLDNFECASQSYKLIGQIDGRKQNELNGLASIEIHKQNYQLAKQLLSQAMAISANNVDTLQLLSLIEKNQGNLNQALAHIQAAYALAPNDPYVLRNLADIYLASNNKQGAKDVIADILNYSPNDPFATLVNSWLLSENDTDIQTQKSFQELTTKVYALSPEIVEQEPTLLLLRGLVSYLQKNYEQALNDFVSLHNKKEQDIQVIALLAKTYIALGKDNEIINLLETNQSVLLNQPDILVLLGETYLRKRKTFRAVDLLAELQKLHPENIQVKLLDIKILLARGKDEEGLVALDKLLAEFPDNNNILLIHSILNLQKLHFDKALSSINTLLVHQPKNANWLNIKAAILIQQGHLVDAKLLLENALKIQPNMLGARYNQATILNLEHHFPQAATILKDILNVNNTHVPSLVLLAKIESAQNNNLEAQKLFSKALVLEPDNIEALQGYVNLLMLQQDWSGALQRINKLESLALDDPQYKLQKAYIYLALNDIEKCQLVIGQLLALADNKPILLLAISQLQMKIEDIKGAESSLKIAQQLDPESFVLAKQLLELLINTNQTDSAVKFITQLDQKFPNHATLLFLHGRIAEQLNKPKEASSFYIKTLEIDDSFELALAKLYTLTSQNYPKDAFLDVVNRIIQKHPQRYFPQNLLAQFYYYNNAFDKAAAQYEKLLKRDDVPNKAGLLNRLAYIYMHSDLVKSESYARSAYELDKEDSQILSNYGWILTQLDKPTEGLKLLRKANVRNAQDPNLKYYIAVSLAKMDLKQQAIAELKALLDSNVEFKEQEAALKLLQQLSQV